MDSDTVETLVTNALVRRTDIFPALRNTWFIACPAPSVHRQWEIGHRLADRFRDHQREEWPSGTCPLQSNKSYTEGHIGRDIEGGPNQPGLPKEAGDEVEIQIWDNRS